MARTSAARKAASVSAPKSNFRFRLTKAGDGHVTLDAQTGLEWSHTIAGRSVEHAGAQGLVDTLNQAKHGGYADWRLPTVEELFLIADRTKRNPAIDAEVFPGTKSDWYWTASSCAGTPVCVWLVFFSLGHALWSGRSYDAFVRAVRGPSARASQ